MDMLETNEPISGGKFSDTSSIINFNYLSLDSTQRHSVNINPISWNRRPCKINNRPTRSRRNIANAFKINGQPNGL